ncbi:hypothetical protein KEM52_006586 [Ascosphaera acerosa]|nr:hypothetical protein KEM52_006586 [Ascosphaera acerosa]
MAPAPASTVDSFASLVQFGPAKSDKNVPLAERQRRLEAQRAAQAEHQRKQLDRQFGNDQFWSTLEGKGRGAATASPPQSQSRNPFAKSSQATTTAAVTVTAAGPTGRQPVAEETEEELLAAFSASAPVDASSYYPVGMSARQSPVPRQATATAVHAGVVPDDDDDDIFGLNQAKPRRKQVDAPTTAAPPADDDEDGILGALAKPVTEFVQSVPETQRTHAPTSSSSSASSPSASPPSTRHAPSQLDQGVAALVDMGFPADQARTALAATDSGHDVQAAVGILLTQAHEESRRKARAQQRARTGQLGDEPRGSSVRASPDRRSDRRLDREPGHGVPPWLRDEGGAGRSARASRSPSTSRSGPGSAAGSGSGESKDASQIAAELGANFLKTANSLWKTSAKKVQQALNDLNEPYDPSQPRWMQGGEGRPADVDVNARPTLPRRPPSRPANPHEEQSGRQDALLTDEARMLEASSGPPQRQPRQSQQTRTRAEEAEAKWHDVLRRRAETSSPGGARSPDSDAGARSRRPAQLPQQQQQQQQQREPMPQPPPSVPSQDGPRSHLSKAVADEQAAQAYVSPARRRRAAPRPEEPPARLEAAHVDLLDSEAVQPPQPRLPTRHKQADTPSAPSRPTARPSRSVPDIPQQTLRRITQLRRDGGEAFRRGDHAAAHEHYGAALAQTPPSHPIAVVLLCNHALTSLKTGEPKRALADADQALAVIGPGNGDSESIDLGDGEASKAMAEFYGKALMRKAEALEQLERWADAAVVWTTAVQAGCGGNTAVQGRSRCQRAAGSVPSSSSSSLATRSQTPAAASRSGTSLATPRALARPRPAAPAVVSTRPAEAVERLRKANLAADRADDEKLALRDHVDELVAVWTRGKKDNLRALLASLDTVLWPEAGWKKIGMAELVLPGKVKINYMKGIAKVHPDKIPINATTEQRMIAGAVFATLNEAWDKFKAENGMA